MPASETQERPMLAHEREAGALPVPYWNRPRTSKLISLLVLALVLGALGSLFVPGPQSPGAAPSSRVSASPPTSPPVLITSPVQAASPTGVSVPPAWTNAGKSPLDFSLAGETVTTFVNRYETLLYNAPSTFEASVFLLTPDAQSRFFGQGPHLIPNKREQDGFRQQVVQAQIEQVARADPITVQLTQIVHSGSHLLVWMTVDYNLLLQTQEQALTLQTLQMYVQLESVPFGGGGLGNGWLVNDWRTN